MNEQILKEIDELIMHNRIERQYAIGFKKDIFRKNNDMLGKVKTILNSRKEYERGLEDAWELASKILLPSAGGNYTYDELEKVFGVRYVIDVMKKFTVHEALAKVQEYERKKEAAKLNVWDIIQVTRLDDRYSERGIYISECGRELTYITTNGTLVTCCRDAFNIVKTGEHVDILEVLKGE